MSNTQTFFSLEELQAWLDEAQREHESALADYTNYDDAADTHPRFEMSVTRHEKQVVLDIADTRLAVFRKLMTLADERRKTNLSPALPCAIFLVIAGVALLMSLPEMRIDALPLRFMVFAIGALSLPLGIRHLWQTVSPIENLKAVSCALTLALFAMSLATIPLVLYAFVNGVL